MKNKSLVELRKFIYNDYVFRHMLAKNKFIQSFYRKEEVKLAKLVIRLKNENR